MEFYRQLAGREVDSDGAAVGDLGDPIRDSGTILKRRKRQALAPESGSRDERCRILSAIHRTGDVRIFRRTRSPATPRSKVHEKKSGGILEEMDDGRAANREENKMSTRPR